MIDITSPDCLTLPEIHRRVVDSGKPCPSLETLRGYIRRGRNGAKLEAVKLGPSWYTTMEAFNRFLSASSQAAPAEAAPPAKPGPASLSLRAQWAIKQAERLGL